MATRSRIITMTLVMLLLLLSFIPIMPPKALAQSQVANLEVSWDQEIKREAIARAADLSPDKETIAVVLEVHENTSCGLDLALVKPATREVKMLNVVRLGNDTTPCKYTYNELARFSPDGGKIAIVFGASFKESPDVLIATIDRMYIAVIDIETGKITLIGYNLSESVHGLQWAGSDTIITVGRKGVIAAFKLPDLSLAWTIDASKEFNSTGYAYAALPSCDDTVIVVSDVIIGVGPEGVRWSKSLDDMHVLVEPRKSKAWCIGDNTVLAYVGMSDVLKINAETGEVSRAIPLDAMYGYGPTENIVYIPDKGLFVYSEEKIALFDLEGNKIAEIENDYGISNIGDAVAVSPDGSVIAVAGSTIDDYEAIQLFKIDGDRVYRILDKYPIGSAIGSFVRGMYWLGEELVVIYNNKTDKWNSFVMALKYRDTPAIILVKDPRTTGKAVIITGGSEFQVSLDRERKYFAVPVYPGQVKIQLNIWTYRENMRVAGPIGDYVKQNTLEYTVTVEGTGVTVIPLTEIIRANLGTVVYTPPEDVGVTIVFTPLIRNPLRWTTAFDVWDNLTVPAVPGKYNVTIKVISEVVGGRPPPSMVQIEVKKGETVVVEASLEIARLFLEGHGSVKVIPLPEGEPVKVYLDGGRKKLLLVPGSYVLKIEHYLDLRVIGPDTVDSEETIQLDVKAGDEIVINIDEMFTGRLALLQLENAGGMPVVVAVVYNTTDEGEVASGIALGAGETEQVYLVPGVEYKLVAVYSDNETVELGVIQAEEGKKYTVRIGGGEDTGAEVTVTEQEDEAAGAETGQTGEEAQAGEQVEEQPGGGELQDAGGSGLDAKTAGVALAVLVLLAAVFLLRSR